MTNRISHTEYDCPVLLVNSKLHIYQKLAKCIDNASVLYQSLNLSVDVFKTVCLRDALLIHRSFQKSKSKSFTFTESSNLRHVLKKSVLGL